ncbi:hypothetical protein LVQ79_15470 [Buttiauxella sp. A2-C1_F]|uniref:hypothetical protein n=1 Tax=unclassified Buttiauxella TaxID=2634062 RepID=UPI001E34855D|nr:MULTISPECIES: hypothetical protein [unclassified Buttiauxella]MCE0801213.1 hypothetical protein [Buttiauxella sp. W03-F01]MCE0813524.1 hypothetical protein [Buttiauxella sp. S04-F03]MCE0846952.1 hypothetical protein [Buttiauxella sp. A2-C1_F]
MSKKSTAKRNEKKVLQPAVAATVVATNPQAEMSYDDMLTELEAIVSEADLRLAEEEGTL